MPEGAWGWKADEGAVEWAKNSFENCTIKKGKHECQGLLVFKMRLACKKSTTAIAHSQLDLCLAKAIEYTLNKQRCEKWLSMVQ